MSGKNRDNKMFSHWMKMRDGWNRWVAFSNVIYKLLFLVCRSIQISPNSNGAKKNRTQLKLYGLAFCWNHLLYEIHPNHYRISILICYHSNTKQHALIKLQCIGFHYGQLKVSNSSEHLRMEMRLVIMITCAVVISNIVFSQLFAHVLMLIWTKNQSFPNIHIS